MIVLFMTFCISAWAQEEYFSLSDFERSRIEGPRRLDSEYQSDVLAFRKPLAWDLNFERENSVLDLSIGSLGAKNFLIHQRVKVERFLEENFYFKFIYFDRGDFEGLSQHKILELGYWVRPAWGLALYGEPGFRKSEDDLGVALLSRWGPWRGRLFHTWTDFSRNERNEEPDEFSRSPRSCGLKIHRADEVGNFSYLLLRHDARTHWESDGSQYIFENTFAQLKDRRMVRDHQVDAFLEVEKKFEEQVDSEFWSKEKSLASVRVEKFLENKWYRPAMGFEWVDRFWVGSLGRLRTQTALPHIGLIVPRLRGPQKDEMSFFYEVSLHWSRGDEEARPDLDSTYASQHRFNWSYQWNFQERAGLKLLFTFDVDRLFSGEFWEGGNGQFFLNF